MPFLDDVVRVLDRALPFVTVSTEPGPATTWFADVAAHVRAGQDPLAPWREAVARSQGSERKPHVSAAFVLQWWCEVAATPIGYAAELGPWELVPSPAGLGLELAPGLYPARIVLRPGAVTVRDVVANRERDSEPDGVMHTGMTGAKGMGDRRELALEAGRAAYLGLVEEVVRDFAPDVKMSSRQRWGVVDDMWATALRNAAGAAGRSVPQVVQRTSCCFIVALPGMRECAGCPRGGHN